MFSDLIPFLAEIKENNNLTWFEPNRPRYKKLQSQFNDLVTDLIVKIGQFDPAIQLLSAKECTFRINRDIRFSNDKSPYKSNMSAAFSPNSKNGSAPSYYLQINADGGMMVGGGEYLLEPSRLLMIRTAIAKDSKPLKKILNNPEFKRTFGELQGETLVTSPKGFDKNHLDIELLKHKNYVTTVNFQDIQNWSDQEFVNQAVQTFKILSPLVKYLREVQPV